ncbi:competence protein ComEC [Filimonas lacunae]|uniref:Competence protein ComEC n=1 Tax=Filimonas lacunae TaxID=477680 RepID=A0A173MPE0_9BACT|nr:ComEC/Rec2 family competence protein [Filimonas lacunae]BAV09329.1 late competence protein ComEC involved in DNA transport [Filimonas lacunae]SIS71244.1 competence protein ComEC [Filimonas lacunae]
MNDVLVELRKIPFGRILLAFMAGIVFQFYIKASLLVLLPVAAVVAICLVVCLLLPAQYRYAIRWLQGGGILLAIAIAGCVVVWGQNIQQQRNWFGVRYQPGALLLAMVNEPPVSKPNSLKAVAVVNSIASDSVWQPATGKIILYFKKDSTATVPAYGTIILIHKTLQPIMGMGNPGGFNYARYCSMQQLYHQVYLQPEDYTVISNMGGSRWWKWLYTLRTSALAIIHRYIPDTQVAGIAAALLMGYRDELDKGLMQAYADTGVVHIIAISGMHLAMIYGMLVMVLAKAGNNGYLRWAKPLLALSVLWLFTLLSGAAPSIVRSAIMFTCIILGEAIGKKHRNINNLAASAFCLLVYDPLYLWDAGFQLSYAAVAGIMLFYRPLYHYIQTQNRLLDYIWQLTAVTLSAQVFTLPVILYYFHQFPVYFVITNMIVVPLSGIILYAEIFLIITAWCTPLATLCGAFITTCMIAMNAFIQHMQQLPCALISSIAFTGWQAALLVGIIVCASFGCWQRSARAWLAAAVLSSIMALIYAIDIIHTRQQQKLVVYNIPHMSAVELVCGNTGYWAGDSTLHTNSAVCNQYIKPTHMLWHVQQNCQVAALQPVALFTYAGKKIALANHKITAPAGNSPVNVDILIIGGTAGYDVKQLAAIFRAKQVVFDSSNPVWKIEKWKKDCDSLHLRFHSVPRDGAFVMEL